MKKILLFLFLLLFTNTVHAQSSEQDLTKKYNVNFPIAELGNCVNINHCTAYCDNPEHKEVCISFAKKKGFYQQTTSSKDNNKDEILAEAKKELGCSSFEACQQFCEKEDNMEKCIDFASRHNLADGGNAAQMKQVLSSLKNAFGCNSMKSCFDACNNSDNAKKCMEIFKQAGFPVEVTYSGPGGCNSEESCRAYCEKNPKECGGVSNFSTESPEVMCSKLSSECKWDGKSCICAGPESCQRSPGCSWNGQYCNCGGDSTKPTESGESWCAKAGSNCQWTGSQCQCSGGSTPSTGSTEKVDFSSQCLSQSGCSWDADSKICSCSTGEQTQPSQKELEKQACQTDKVCHWDGQACVCPQSVQGVATNRSLLQQILDFILGK